MKPSSGVSGRPRRSTPGFSTGFHGGESFAASPVILPICRDIPRPAAFRPGAAAVAAPRHYTTRRGWNAPLRAIAYAADRSLPTHHVGGGLENGRGPARGSVSPGLPVRAVRERLHGRRRARHRARVSARLAL